MHVVIGRVRIKPGFEDQTLAMIGEHGVAMLKGMAGSAGGYWARTPEGEELIQHSFWLFDTEVDARAAETMFGRLRDMPEAPTHRRCRAWCLTPAPLRHRRVGDSRP